MPHADEALKALIARFERSPAESFVELAAGLLARGHAAESLRVVEHGLQLSPDSVSGRIERAAGLLALGRPRVAYVELRRALAVEPKHRRGLRLLGRTFKDAGVPGRAAELLAQRFDAADRAPSTVALPPTRPEDVGVDRAPVPSEPSASLDPNLFSNLTVDLGLGAAVPEVAQKPVEITQIIRRRGMPRPPRSASELAAIDGPIVDTTQPGQIIETSDPVDPLDPPTLAPLFDLADEPLFQDATPFEVRPVASTDLAPLPLGDEASATVVDQIVPNGPSDELAGDLGLAARDPLVEPPPRSAPGGDPPTTIDYRAPAMAPPDRTPPRAPLTESTNALRSGAHPAAVTRPPAEAATTQANVPPAVTAPLAAAPTESSATLPPTPEAARPTEPRARPLGLAAVERARPAEGRVVVVQPKLSPTHALFAVLGLAAMALYVATLVVGGYDALAVWWPS